MRLQAEPAFVLHAWAWRETSLLVEVLTRHHGRVGLVARGVMSARRHVQRAALQPLQYVRLDAVLHGELAQLVLAEALDAAPVLAGEALLSALYANELVLRFAHRLDPQPELFHAYARLRARFAAGAHLGWSLRRFEAGLLDAVGLGFDWRTDAEGGPVQADIAYRLDPEQGPRAVRDAEGVPGAALLALAATRTQYEEAAPPPGLAALRRGLRGVLSHHLHGPPLAAWRMPGEWAEVAGNR
jgi:DNA repair protein RecO (recombination protein O)